MIYLKFNEAGMQSDTTMAAKKPAGWYKAPNDFKWEKRYQLVNKKVVEIDPERIRQAQLKQAKKIAKDTVVAWLDECRATSYSPMKSVAYEAQYKAAKEYLANGKESQSFRKLAVVRGATTHEMAELVISKAEAASERLIILEALEDQADQLIEASNTIEELEMSIQQWKEKLEKIK